MSMDEMRRGNKALLDALFRDAGFLKKLSGEEISEDELDDVSGGTRLRPFLKAIGAVKLINPERPGLQPVIPPVKTR